ncbi:MAG: N-acetyl-alpha-D-glucosaminyl L-malate synthase BshA [Cytophagales bacterium]|nr:N-acetyl-alpha-D-glucosaminyl L-malate synthase BshA [Cytophagales bacterium]
MSLEVGDDGRYVFTGMIPFRIGIVCYPTYGGSGVIATELGIGLADRGHQVHFISSSRPGRLSFHEQIYYHGVNVFSYPLFAYQPYESALASKVVEVCSRHALDLLHVHYAIPHASSGYMAREILKGRGYVLPLLTTLHGTDITLVGQDPSYAPVVAFSIQSSDAVTAVSENLREATYEYLGCKKDIEVIPNFVDLKRFSPPTQKDINKMRIHFCQHKKNQILIHVSNFREVKNPLAVVRIFAQVQKQRDVCLLMVGEGPERLEAQALSRSLGIEDQVHFLGEVDRVNDYLFLADVFLLPSLAESFGLAALEAMACGVPVVASNRGGLPDLIEEKKSGFLCDPMDLEAMTKAVLHILDNQKSFQQEARLRASDFDLSNILPRYENLYSAILKKAGKSKT